MMHQKTYIIKYREMASNYIGVGIKQRKSKILLRALRDKFKHLYLCMQQAHTICEEIYSDVISGVKSHRPGLDKALNYPREGDTLIVWKLDRLGRSIQHLIQAVSALLEKKIGFKSLQENMDTSTINGQLLFHIFGALAKFEHSLIREQTQTGLKAARTRGKMGGRPPLLDMRQINRMIEMYDEQKNTVAEICKIYNISRPSFYNYLNNRRRELIKNSKG
jgi:DNA invertase Pin-like site-specific DNA recombinase